MASFGVGLVQRGARPVPWIAFVPTVELPVDDEAYPRLRMIDPYDETMFSAFQCNALIADFERLATDQPGPDRAEALKLVRRCAASSDMAIWFIGD